MTKSGFISLLALAPAASLAAPLPAGIPVFNTPQAAPAPEPVTLSPAPSTAYSPAMQPAAAVPEVVDIPETAPLPPYVDQPMHGVSLHLLYGFSAAPDNEFATDVMGLNVQGVWFFTPHQAFTLDISFAGGWDHARLAALDDHEHHWLERYKFSRSRISIMPGYEVRVPLNRARNVYFIAGGKAGLDIAMMHVTDTDSYYYDHGHYYEDFRTKGTVGFAYAGMAGFSIRCSHSTWLDIGYQYFGSTAEPDVTYRSRNHHSRTKLQAHSMRWHEVHIGTTFRF